MYTCRYISQSRQRNKFIPFALRNSTGLPLSFTTLTSLPSEVFAGSSVYTEHSRRQLATPPLWIEVDPMEEKPFDFLPHQKMRHKVRKREIDTMKSQFFCLLCTVFASINLQVERNAISLILQNATLFEMNLALMASFSIGMYMYAIKTVIH